MNRRPLPGGFLVLLGAVFWSLNSPIVKYLTLDSVLICGLRSLIAALALAAIGRAAAVMPGRDYAIPEDLQALFCETIAHRFVLDPQSNADRLTLAREILQSVKAPRIR